MILIIGLGNPGKKYQNNRHNVGYLFVDYLVNKLTSSSIRQAQDKRINELKIVKTDCFMNQSGIFVKKLIENCLPAGKAGKLKIENLIIVHDDLDIPLGKFHIQKGVGPKLHNGLESIDQYLKTKDFWRIRIGVDARKPDLWVDGESYVLKNFLREEKTRLEKEIFPKIFTQFQIFLKTQFLLSI